jgi:hypothetical protein
MFKIDQHLIQTELSRFGTKARRKVACHLRRSFRSPAKFGCPQL